MKTVNTLLALLFTAITLTACTTDAKKNEKDVTALIQQAKQSFNEVNAVGFAWRDTEEMIKDAEIAQVENDIPNAIELAEEAIMQNKLAMEQYEMQKNAGPLPESL